MRVLVTGAGGQLGGDLCTALAAHGHTALTARSEDGGRLDITRSPAVVAAVRALQPDAVVNCAAWTRVDAAEACPDDAFSVNAVGPRVIAAACAAAHLSLVHVSTDFVFDGSATAPIDEWASPSPLSVYGASKLAGEEEVRTLCRRHQIVRTSWLYGRQGPNFVLTMLRLAQERPVMRVVGDQWGSPTWTGHLAPAIVRLLELGVPGTYHLTNSGHTTWHGFAQAIMDEARVAETTVAAIGTDDYPTAARRPRYSVLDNRAWRLLGETALPPWRDGLRAYLREVISQQKDGGRMAQSVTPPRP